MTTREERAERLMKRTAELIADSKTPILDKYLGKEEMADWNRTYAVSDTTDPHGDE
jgi:hypothetical protein